MLNSVQAGMPAPRVCHVADQMNRLEGLANQSTKTVEEARQAFAPILRPGMPKDSAEPASIKETRVKTESDLALKLSNIADELSTMLDDMRDLVDRVDV